MQIPASNEKHILHFLTNRHQMELFDQLSIKRGILCKFQIIIMKNTIYTVLAAQQ